jgi:hypothetical protein
MSNEEFERYKDFILEQQAQSAVKIAQIENNLAQLAENTTRLAEATLARFEATDKRIDEVDEKIAALVDSQLLTQKNLTRLEENLRNLVAVVDRYFSEGRNGKPEV